MNTVVEELAKFTYTWRGGAGADGCMKGAAGCRITADYASKDGLPGLDRAGYGGWIVSVFCRITRSGAGATKLFFSLGVLAPRKFLPVF